jgi:proteasome lid subunit RPN8/RPN11
VILELTRALLSEIQKHGEAAYPEEGAGFLLGTDEGGSRRVAVIRPLANDRQGPARRNRYLLSSQDLYQAELVAERRGLDLIGVFHSHPDHPPEPSAYDREWAMPWFSYIITSVLGGQAELSRSWRLSDDRQRFDEEWVAFITEDQAI